jgi:hypothetical protein
VIFWGELTAIAFSCDAAVISQDDQDAYCDRAFIEKNDRPSGMDLIGDRLYEGTNITAGYSCDRFHIIVPGNLGEFGFERTIAISHDAAVNSWSPRF